MRPGLAAVALALVTLSGCLGGTAPADTAATTTTTPPTATTTVSAAGTTDTPTTTAPRRPSPDPPASPSTEEAHEFALAHEEARLHNLLRNESVSDFGLGDRSATVLGSNESGIRVCVEYRSWSNRETEHGTIHADAVTTAVYTVGDGSVARTARNCSA
jgi:hypothetical protein